MELLEALKKRRSVRFFKDTDIDKTKIQSILEAATWAPTAGNVQPWFFVAVTEKNILANIKTFSPGIIGVPKAVIVACIDYERVKQFNISDESELLATIDLSMACQNLMLAALEYGIGTCAVRSFNQVAVAKILDLPETIKPQLLIALGYPAKVPPAPPKLPLNEVVQYEKYGGIENE